MTRSIVVGVFDNIQDVKAAIDRLHELAFKQIFVSGPAIVRKELPFDLLADEEMAAMLLRGGATPEEISFFRNEVKTGRILLMIMTAVGFNAAEVIIRDCKGRTQPPKV